MKKNIRIDVDNIKNNIKKEFQTIDKVALTTDCWTARYSQSGYIANGAYYVDNKVQYFNRLLSLYLFTADETAENLALQIEKSIAEYNLENKIVAIVTDGGSNIVKAVDNTDYCRFSCILHKLNLFIKDNFYESNLYTEILRKILKTINTI